MTNTVGMGDLTFAEFLELLVGDIIGLAISSAFILFTAISVVALLGALLTGWSRRRNGRAAGWHHVAGATAMLVFTVICWMIFRYFLIDFLLYHETGNWFVSLLDSPRILLFIPVMGFVWWLAARLYGAYITRKCQQNY